MELFSDRDEYYDRVTAFSNSLEPNEHLASSGQPKLMSQKVREKLISTLQAPGSGQDWEHFLLGNSFFGTPCIFIISFWLRQKLKEKQCVSGTLFQLSSISRISFFSTLSALAFSGLLFLSLRSSQYHFSFSFET